MSKVMPKVSGIAPAPAVAVSIAHAAKVAVEPAGIAVRGLHAVADNRSDRFGSLLYVVLAHRKVVVKLGDR